MEGALFSSSSAVLEDMGLRNKAKAPIVRVERDLDKAVNSRYLFIRRRWRPTSDQEGEGKKKKRETFSRRVTMRR